jgi:aconitate hydratase
MLVPPLDVEEAQRVEPVKGPNISSLPELSPLPDELEAPVLLKLGDNISTDEISPAGVQALPLRSNIPKLAMFSFTRVDDSYPERAQQADDSGHVIVAGENYGQGSSREHAAIAPRYLGLRVVIAKSFARIHWQNLANYGILALEFENPDDYDSIDQDDTLRFQNLNAIDKEDVLQVENAGKDSSFAVRHRLSPRQVKDVLAGGLIPRLNQEQE